MGAGRKAWGEGVVLGGRRGSARVIYAWGRRRLDSFGKKVIYKYIKLFGFDFLSRFGRFVSYVMV